VSFLKTNKKRKRDISAEIEELWKDLQQKLQEVAEEYKSLKTEISDIDAFLREVVNNVVVLLQEIHESISILEDKIAALESGKTLVSPQTPSPQPSQPMVPQSREEIPPPIPPSIAAKKTVEEKPLPETQATPPPIRPTKPTETIPTQSPAVVPTPSERPARPSAPTSVRFEIISQLKQVLEERRRRIKKTR